MRLSGPFRYRLEFDSMQITAVENPDGGNKLSGPAAQRVPKLYVVSQDEKPLYVGITRQTLRTRLRMGFQADSGHGYHGYAWRHQLRQANVDVWVQDGDETSTLDLETVEAEVVFLIRQQQGQWPEHQTEIHFHQSEETHRQLARSILEHYVD